MTRPPGRAARLAVVLVTVLLLGGRAAAYYIALPAGSFSSSSSVGVICKKNAYSPLQDAWFPNVLTLMGADNANKQFDTDGTLPYVRGPFGTAFRPRSLTCGCRGHTRTPNSDKASAQVPFPTPRLFQAASVSTKASSTRTTVIGALVALKRFAGKVPCAVVCIAHARLRRRALGRTRSTRPRRLVMLARPNRARHLFHGAPFRDRHSKTATHKILSPERRRGPTTF